MGLSNGKREGENRGSGRFREPPEASFPPLASGRAWAASPPDRQHGVDVSAQATGVRQGGRELLGGPCVVRWV